MKILQKLIATGLIALLSVTSIAQAAETVTYFHNDLLGSPTAATDESGEIIWRENYQAFGEKVKNQDEQTGNVIGYTGHVHDEDTGLTYMQARYYDPVIGRFYADDPVGFEEHIEGAQGTQGFNRYAYVNNNPYKFVDPDGMEIRYSASSEIEEEFLKSSVNRLADNSPTAANIIKRLDDADEVFTVMDGLSSYNKEDNIIMVDRYFQSDRPDMQVPPEIILGHELIHAIHDLEGNFSWFFEEKNTVGDTEPCEGECETENQIRREYRENGKDIPLREEY